MKLLVFGATGGTGRQLVEQAIAQGHEVTAFVRNPAAVDIRHPKLAIVQGDAMDAAAVERVIPGHDAVLSALGAPAIRTGTVRSEGTRNIVRAMERRAPPPSLPDLARLRRQPPDAGQDVLLFQAHRRAAPAAQGVRRP